MTAFPICPSDSADLARLNAEIFPDDAPPDFASAEWRMAWSNFEPIAFCGWKRLGNLGFHYRSGVLPSFRGKGLQREMIELRERAMRESGLGVAVTYTETYSAASMNTLIKCGYRVVRAGLLTAWVPQDRYQRMVAWRKDLA